MSDLETVQNKYRGRRVTVVGVGISNRPLIDFLLSAGARVSARDKKSREELEPAATDLEKRGVRLILGENYLRGIDEDVIFRTPGMRFDRPEFAETLARGAEMTSEMQLFFEICPCPIIGVTGSDGKTTTTTLIAEMLKADGKCVFLGGNIGKPLLSEAAGMTPSDFAVVELSSFQLHTMTRSPSVAVVTNIAPNHLDYHLDMAEYVAAKENILRHQGPGDRAVLNYSNAYTRAAAAKTSGKVVFFSSREKPEGADAVYEEGGTVYAGGRAILSLSDIRLPGRHNVENCMAAVAALDGVVSPAAMREVAREFGGVEHRIEFVRTLDGVSYYNSSIDSSPTRTIAALSAFGEKKLLVLLGGYDKKIPYEPLGAPLCEHAKAIFLTGDTADKIEKAVTASPAYRPSAPAIYRAADYAEALLMARRAAVPGDVVLLSPASASFDAFRNFEERGNYFKRLVHAL